MTKLKLKILIFFLGTSFFQFLSFLALKFFKILFFQFCQSNLKQCIQLDGFLSQNYSLLMFFGFRNKICRILNFSGNKFFKVWELMLNFKVFQNYDFQNLFIQSQNIYPIGWCCASKWMFQFRCFVIWK